jgi:hypothetical protein
MSTDTTITVKTGPALTIGGGALVIIGALLPWVTLTHVFGSASFAGMDGDGKFALIAGIALIAGGWHQARSERFIRWPGVVAILTAGFAAVELMWIGYNVAAESSDYARASIGVGLYVFALGAAAAVTGAFKSRNAKPELNEITVAGPTVDRGSPT